MKKILDYFLSSIYLLYFGFILVFFDVLQRIALNIFGKKAHQKVVEALNFFIVYGWYLTGSTVKFEQKQPIPMGRSIIFIANHQSMFDIPGIIWFLRKHTPLFVSKIELAKGIPSISYNLRKGGAALIDRKDHHQALKAIGELGDYIRKNSFSAAIFPEGTRSKTGELKEFSSGGVSILLQKCPDALVVPIAIDNLLKFNPKGYFPLRSFTKMSWTTLNLIDPKNKSIEEVISLAKSEIQSCLNEKNQALKIQE
jgi:1-acyl-sn-glycerol-3-phosphate acyltransferase